MATPDDIFQIIAHEISKLEDSTPEARRRVYDFARHSVQALERQGTTQQRWLSAIDDAIRRIEESYLRKESALSPGRIWGETINDRLKRLITLVEGCLAVFGLTFVLRYMLNADQFFKEPGAVFSFEAWKSFLMERGEIALAAVIICASFWLGKNEGKRFFETAKTLFLQQQIPTNWGGVDMRYLIPLVVVGYLVNLGFMVLFINDLRLLSVLVGAVYAISLLNNHIQRKNLKKYLEARAFSPPPEHEELNTIQWRRSVVIDYWFSHHHQTREAIALAICVSVCAISVFAADARVVRVLFLVLSATIMTNEVVLLHWRSQRDLALSRVDFFAR